MKSKCCYELLSPDFVLHISLHVSPGIEGINEVITTCRQPLSTSKILLFFRIMFFRSLFHILQGFFQLLYSSYISF